MVQVKQVIAGTPPVTGVSTLKNLTDVTTQGLAHHDMLVYDAENNKYRHYALDSAFAFDSANNRIAFSPTNINTTSLTVLDSANIASKLTVAGLRLPVSDGTVGMAIVTDGNGILTFQYAGTESGAVVSNMQDLTDVESTLNENRAGGDYLRFDSATGKYISSNFDTDAITLIKTITGTVIAGTGITFDSAAGIVSITDTGVVAGTYGSASLVPIFTINAQGQIDSAGTLSVAGVSSTSYDSSTGILTINTADGGSFYTTLHDSADHTARARYAISVNDAGGDGSFSYDNTTGVITYTGSSTEEVRAKMVAGTGVTYDSAAGRISITDTTVTAGTYGSASLVPVFTVNAQGQIDSAGTVSVAGVSSVAFDSASYVYTISTADGGSYPQQIHTRMPGTPGIYGSASLVPVVTVNEFGLVDSVHTISVAGVSSTSFDSANGQFTINTADGGVYITRMHDSADLLLRARQSVTSTDAGGDGSFTYNRTTGNFTYTGPSATEARAHFSAGTGVTLASGQISIAQAVDSNADIDFNSVTINDVSVYGQQAGGISINVDQSVGNANQTVFNIVSDDSAHSAVLALSVKNQVDHAAISIVGNDASNELVVGFSGTAGSFKVKNNVGSAPFDIAGGTTLFTVAPTGTVTVPSSTEASSKTAAALVVTGGLGVSKNIRGQDIIAAGNVTATGNLFGPLSAASLSARSTTDLTEGTRKYYTDARVDSYVNTSIFTTDIQEGTRKYYTKARTDSDARRAVSVTDAGGDGSLAYNNTTGVITYTGPSATEVRARFSAGAGVTLTSGVIAIGQAVATTSTPEFAGGSFTGNVSITGDLTVGGGYIINTTTDLRVTNALIKLADSNTNDLVDIGVAGRYSDDGGSTIRRAGFFRDATNGEWYTFTNLIQGGLDSADATINVNDPSFELGTWNFGALRGQYLGFDSDFRVFSTNYSIYDSDFTAVSAGRYAINTTSGQVTVTLPESPVSGDYVKLIDVGNWATYGSVIVGRNGSTIEGFAEDFELDLGQSIVEFIYINNTWQLYSSIGQKGATGDKGDSAEVAEFSTRAQTIAFAVALG